MTKVKNVAKYSLIITIILIFSKIMGFSRELIIAIVYGATRESDIFKIATTIPNVLFSCVAAALVTTFIPVFSNVKKNTEEANKFFNNIINLVGILCVLLSIIGIISSPLLVKLFASGFQGNDYTQTIMMTRIVMPSIIFLGMSGLYTGFLQSHSIFLQPAMTGIAADVVIILGIVIFNKYGIYAAVIAFFLSSIAQVLIQRPFIPNYKYKFYINIKDEHIRKMIRLGLPVLISTAVSQVNLMVDRTFASRLVAGSISVVDYASKLSTIINQVFIVSITTVLYPMLTERFANNDKKGYNELFVKTVNIIFMVAIPLIFGMIILSTPLVRLLLQHGKFDSNASQITSLCLRYLAVGTLGYALLDSLSKVFFSTKETVIPMIDGFIMVALNILFIFYFAPREGVIGLALATTLSSLIVALIMLVQLKLKLKEVEFGSIFISFVKCLIAGLLMALSVYLVFNLMSNLVKLDSMIYLLIKIIVPSIIGVIIYIGLLIIFKVEELNTLIPLKFKNKFIKGV